LAENPEEDQGEEETIALSGIVRVLTHIIARVPLESIDASLSQLILNTAFEKAIKAMQFSNRNIMLCDFSLALLLATLRRLLNLKFKNKMEVGT